MNWSIITNSYRTVVHFSSQTELALFLVEVARLADQMDHHPDVSIRHCNELSMAVYSHDRRQITPRDERLVNGINAIYERWKTKKADE